MTGMYLAKLAQTGFLGTWFSATIGDADACREADCLHPCYGASHESNCNSCMNGLDYFQQQVRYLDHEAHADHLDAMFTQVEAICGKCQVPPIQELSVELKSIKEVIPEYQTEHEFRESLPTFYDLYQNKYVEDPGLYRARMEWQ